VKPLLVAFLVSLMACRSPASRGNDVCPEPSVAGGSATTAIIAVDLPRASAFTTAQVFFAVTLAADGRAFVNGEAVANDDGIVEPARAALAKEAELRAIIRADRAVVHGRVIHVMDLLRQAGISQIAFGVAAEPPTPRRPDAVKR